MKKKGAEASVKIGEDEVIKTREPKKYRHEKLDKQIRERRTSEELKNIKRARKYGVNAPESEEKDTNTIKQKKIDGKPLKKTLKEDTDLMKQVGENVAKMHSADVIHGDLTTSNIIDGEKIFLIDFGLSEVSDRVEDKAVDIHLLKQVLNSSHPEVADDAWKDFTETYQKYEEARKVLERLEEVEKRGRYK